MDRITFRDHVNSLYRNAYWSGRFELTQQSESDKELYHRCVKDAATASTALMSYSGDVANMSHREEEAKKVAKRLRKIEAQLYGEGTVLDRALNRAAVNSQGFWDKQQYLDRIAFIAGAAWDAMEKEDQSREAQD